MSIDKDDSYRRALVELKSTILLSYVFLPNFSELANPWVWLEK
jgi:antibiotic biosynthesis monooxygenase (ABM) superfamily enzyme